MKWELIGTGLAILALGVSMFLALPPPWWPKMPALLIQAGLMCGLALTVVGAAIIVLGIWPMLALRMGPIVLMTLGTVLVAVGAVWYFGPSQTPSPNPSEDLESLKSVYQRYVGEKTRKISFYGRLAFDDFQVASLIGQQSRPDLKDNQHLGEMLETAIARQYASSKDKEQVDADFNEILAEIKMTFPKSQQLAGLIDKASFKNSIVTEAPKGLPTDEQAKWIKEREISLNSELNEKINRPLEALSQYLDSVVEGEPVEARAATKSSDDPDRPWVAVEIVPGPIAFDSRGAQVFFNVQLSNVGRSPALNVTVRAKVLNSQAANIVGEQNSLLPPGTDQPNFPHSGETLFQTKDSAQRFGLIVSNQEMDLSKTFQGFHETDLLLHIVAAVDYVTSSSGEHHQSYGAIFIWSEDAKRGSVIRNVDVPATNIRYVKESPSIPSN
jgi:hypothetical protein